jgi:hypothetical protein
MCKRINRFSVPLTRIFTEDKTGSYNYYIPTPQFAVPQSAVLNSAGTPTNKVVLTDLRFKLIPDWSSIPANADGLYRLDIRTTVNGSDTSARYVTLAVPKNPKSMPSYDFTLSSFGIPLNATMRVYNVATPGQDEVRIYGNNFDGLNPIVLATFTFFAATSVSNLCSNEGSNAPLVSPLPSKAKRNLNAVR